MRASTGSRPRASANEELERLGDHVTLKQLPGRVHRAAEVLLAIECLSSSIILRVSVRHPPARPLALAERLQRLQMGVQAPRADSRSKFQNTEITK
jgi:hypothetical protein